MTSSRKPRTLTTDRMFTACRRRRSPQRPRPYPAGRRPPPRRRPPAPCRRRGVSTRPCLSTAPITASRGKSSSISLLAQPGTALPHTQLQDLGPGVTQILGADDGPAFDESGDPHRGRQARGDGRIDAQQRQQRHVVGPVDQADGLAGTEMMRQQAGHDVGFFVIADRHEAVHVGHALAGQQVRVRAFPMQHQGAPHLFGGLPTFFLIAIDDLDLDPGGHQITRQFASHGVRADDHHLLQATGLGQEVDQGAVHHAPGAGHEDLVVGQDHRVAARDEGLLAAHDGRHQGDALAQFLVDLGQGLALRPGCRPRPWRR